ncbi:MAG: hypothetical protein ACQETE_13220 [Bacteroidota bacterium]
MIIGQDSNNQIFRFLLKVADKLNNEVGPRLSVEELRNDLDFEDEETKNILGYLTKRSWIQADRIGGSFLYDEISLTEEGQAKVAAIRAKQSS